MQLSESSILDRNAESDVLQPLQHIFRCKFLGWISQSIFCDSRVAADYSFLTVTVSFGKAFDPNYWERMDVALPAAIVL